MLTRDEIDAFVHLAPSLCLIHIRDVPLCFRQARLVQEDTAGHGKITPAGHDLLATVPHLPAPEPNPAPPSCARCGGSGEVPLFMGPMMVDCPECTTAECQQIADAIAAGVMTQTDAADVIISSSAFVPDHPGDRPTGDAWVLIDSAERARTFVGRSVYVHAPCVERLDLPAHPMHGRSAEVKHVHDSGPVELLGVSQRLSFARGNVYLRPVAE